MFIPPNVTEGIKIFDHGEWFVSKIDDRSPTTQEVEKLLADLFPLIHDRELILTITETPQGTNFRWDPAYPAVRYITLRKSEELEKKA